MIYDSHTLSPVDGLSAVPPGTYTVGVKVYLWDQGAITDQPTADGQNYQVLGTMQIP